MTISGNVGTMPFADLLQWVSQSRKTGTLSVEGPRFVKKIYFKDGFVVAAASENPKEFLSYYLVGWGIVAEKELEELLDMQERHGTLLGELLVIIGRLDREELQRILRVKTEEAVYELFVWEEGEFRFLDNILPVKSFHPLNLAVDLLVLEGVRRVDEWSLIREVIPDNTWVPRVVRPLLVEEMGETARNILREIDGTNSVEQIALTCRLALFHVQHFVAQGLRQDLFELRPPRGEEGSTPGFSHGSWRVLLMEADRALADGDVPEALRLVTALRAKYGDRREALELVTAVERKIDQAVEDTRLPDDVILELAVPAAELTNLSCSPAEGFLLSRINGAYTLGEVLQVVPGTDLEKRVMVSHLMGRELVKVKDAGESGEGG